MLLLPLLLLLLCGVWPAQAGYQFVDLSHVQNDKTIYWTGVPTFVRTVQFADLNAAGVWIEVGAYSSGEHGGTHIDAPRHFVPTGLDLSEFPLERTVAEGVTIDCTAEAAADYDYAVTVDKLQQWEEENGRIPNEAAVLIYTGYAQKFSDPEAYFNTDQLDNVSTFHFPYMSPEGAQWLLDHRDIKMLGMDVPSPDFSRGIDYPVHLILLPANVLLLENVNIPPSLPPRDFRVHAAPIRVENGTGVQTRIYAMLYDRAFDDDGSNGAGKVASQISWSMFVGIAGVVALMRLLRW